jgi:hypothetical protein
MGAITGLRAKKQLKQPSGLALASGKRTTQAATTIDKDDFILALPGAWQEQPTDDGFEFVNPSSGEQLIVSILHGSTFAALSELRHAVEFVETTRRTMIDTASQNQAILGLTEFRGTERDIDARFDGHDPQNGVRFSVAIRGCAMKILTLSLYRYSLDELAIPFAVYASLIFNLLKLKSD